MEKSESKKLIPVYLQQLFLEKTDAVHYIRMPEILSFLESKGIYADRRTIYSAISILNSAGFEITGVQEKGGYKYHHPARTFDSNELKFLIDSVAASKFLTERKAKELIEKIKSLGSVYNRESLNRNILLGNRIKSMNDKVLKNLDTIYEAINGNKRIHFHYMKWTPQKKLIYVRKGQQYEVSPFAVTLNDNNYYLIAFDGKYQGIRHYRIDKMQAISVSENNREGREQFKQFNINDYMQKTFGMFHGEEQTVSIQCNNSLAGVFIDRFGDKVTIRPDFKNPKVFIARVTVYVSSQFFAWLFALDEDVKILSPQSVMDKYAAMIDRVANQYRK
ncbi:MAG: WYL domain-containing protein [Clostridiales bacterium]|nr:WYL domain-containing protein [Clostridiales bacterium]